jgi:hypothetical protein
LAIIVSALGRFGRCRRPVEFADQIHEPVRYTLANNIVVYRAELMADSRLNLGTESAMFARRRILAGLRL